MRVAWPTLVLGLLLTAGGLWLANQGWATMAEGAPSASGIASLGAGVLLTLLGLLLAIVPLLVPLLYKLYGEAAFTTRAATCPVVLRCARCGEFNFRGRAQCKACAMTLAWVPGAAAALTCKKPADVNPPG